MFKPLIIGSLSIVSLILVAVAPVQGQNIDSPQKNLTPRKLISLARQGRFNAQGIPGYSNFRSNIVSGKVNAQKLIASAVAQNRLPETALQDTNYINAVNHHLKSGGCGSL